MKVRKGIEKLVIRAAKIGVNNPSAWSFYQPKEPQAVKKLKRK